MYELTEGYYSDTWAGIPEYVSYTFRPNMTQEEIDAMDDFIFMNNNVLPTIGSRVFDRIYVFEPVLLAQTDDVIGRNPQVVMDWTDIQDKNYRYVCWLDRQYLHVRLVVKEFLFAQIAFRNT